MLKRLISLVGGAVLLAGCSVYGNLEDLQNADRTGSAFTNALANEYQAFAEFEMFEMRDYVDGDHFARKGLRAAAGEVVLPEDPANWDVPADRMNVLNGARNRLLRALDGGGRDMFPAEAALAQAKYDCWVEQQEENHQPDHIAACMDEFVAAMEKLEMMMAPPPAPEPEPEPEPMMMDPANFIVFFDWDSSDVSDGASQVLGLVVSKLGDYENGTISLVGHTDTSGSNDYNDRLSLDRANNVRFMLIEMGVPASRISVEAKGESEPLEATGDGVRNPQNRRVEITIQ
ncbi:MAG: OmpA family protein [Alphaproteobacteria bacterium]